MGEEHAQRPDIRRSYDAVAADYLTHFGDELARKPLDRALLEMLVEELGSGATVADLGSGPGHVAAWLAVRGVRAVAIDLSAEMVAVGASAHTDVEFRQGDLVQLPAADGEFDGVVCFYSLIHLAAGELAVAAAEIHRVLRPGGMALVSFHTGSEIIHRDEWWGHDVDLDFRLLDPASVVATLTGAGLSVQAELYRGPYPDEAVTRRAYLLAVRPGLA